ncbi:sodium-translocating pyrophosphatase [Carboxydochorda subterranea]|uniref:K(+)-insensitive pyrophosphate-energized proton pump n=1 Tax=Carboxydichorda subterranea TaxID=3109565 RepID=A0ABZ1BWJ0_9FIRM|nr:sodium-translocating pyrophosphatase [Limnochorda sp. L945t]WRP17170.1 sodium-translocating pyrophosphatase [Limnochorda sp. L945t]
MTLTPFETGALWVVLLVAVAGLAYAAFLRSQVMREETGTARMREVWDAIRQGADAYLRRQLGTILPFIGVLTVLLFLSVYVVPPSPQAVERFAGYDPGTVRLIVGLGRAIAFIMGAVFSLLVGQLGMRMAVQGNIRVAAAARSSFDRALRIAYRSGTVTGMLTDGLGLLGGTVIFMYFGKAAPDALLGFGFGGTLLALFMRVGGGIYTKAADVGADLVGKVEKDIPEDDPRNAAVIADLVGDNVGDCAGMAADIFESYEVTIVSGLILGLTLVHLTGDIKWIIFPLLVRAIGVFASIVGTYRVRGHSDERGDAMGAINRGFYTSAAVSIVGFALVAAFYMHEWRAFASVVAGVILAIVIDELTRYFTDGRYAPVREIQRSTDGGPATTIITGLAVGYESTVWAVLVIGATILSAIAIYWSYPVASLADKVHYILYGVAMTGIGMLTLTGNNVAMDSYGPISDNANGIGEMAGLEPKARQIMADLDAVGNTTKAITKGVAIGSAVIAAVSLFGSFVADVSMIDPQALANGIRVSEPMVFVGLLIGGSVPWLFSSLSIKAVGRAAGLIVQEVRRQFRIPGIMEGTVKPDYARAVQISTVAAQKELVSLATLAVMGPIVVGLALGVEALGGFLAGAILSGQLLAVFMANAGGAWDNAKKLIEDEPRDLARNTGKGSERHKAGVVGDTVGDPLKDTAGPALNPMIKVVNLVSLIIAPIIVRYQGISLGTGLVIVLALAAVAWAIRTSKREAPAFGAVGAEQVAASASGSTPPGGLAG